MLKTRFLNCSHFFVTDEPTTLFATTPIVKNLLAKILVKGKLRCVRADFSDSKQHKKTENLKPKTQNHSLKSKTCCLKQPAPD